MFSSNKNQRAKKRDRAERTTKEGALWAESPVGSLRVAQLWEDIEGASSEGVCSKSVKGRKWKAAVLELLAISDEACCGAGYPDTYSSLVQAVLGEQTRYYQTGKSELQLPNSLAWQVSADVACVLPKAMTPDVGCTLRSLSHHLAMLPSRGLVKVVWRLTDYAGKPANSHPDYNGCTHCFNLLLIPFPYVVHATDFVQSRVYSHNERVSDKDTNAYFSVDQGWLRYRAREITNLQFAKFIGDLIRAAERDARVIHGIVLPECALTRERAIDLAGRLSKEFPKLEYLITGTFHVDKQTRRNEAYVFRLDGRGIVAHYGQSKHHRWKLNARQIGQYQLGGALDPNKTWWEHIDVSDRTLELGVNRHDAVLAALVCEDLARQDPVLPIIAAIGPTLVVALLMDGPQLESRWSARYATVLAEDPGCSVLTLTCLGMIKRSQRPGGTIKPVIGLWKDRDSAATELTLPEGHHGLVLSLTPKSAEQLTIDLRSDNGMAVEYRLSGVNAVALGQPPKWLERAD
jgi:hypothetical protein